MLARTCAAMALTLLLACTWLLVAATAGLHCMISCLPAWVYLCTLRMRVTLH